MGFTKFLFAPVASVGNQDFRLVSSHSFDLLEGGCNGMAIVRISRQRQGSEDDPAVTGSGDRDFGPEFVGFMGFAFGNAADMRFVKAIDFMLIRFVLKEDAPAIQQGLGIGLICF